MALHSSVPTEPAVEPSFRRPRRRPHARHARSHFARQAGAALGGAGAKNHFWLGSPDQVPRALAAHQFRSPKSPTCCISGDALARGPRGICRPGHCPLPRYPTIAIPALIANMVLPLRRGEWRNILSQSSSTHGGLRPAVDPRLDMMMRATSPPMGRQADEAVVRADSRKPERMRCGRLRLPRWRRGEPDDDPHDIQGGRAVLPRSAGTPSFRSGLDNGIIDFTVSSGVIVVRQNRGAKGGQGRVSPFASVSGAFSRGHLSRQVPESGDGPHQVAGRLRPAG
jgi:hypothetical protein